MLISLICMRTLFIQYLDSSLSLQVSGLVDSDAYLASSSLD